MRPTFFPTAAALRHWFDEHGASATEVLVGFHKKALGRSRLTYAEALDEALCVGWIDGIRRRVDDAGYSIRFTPRKSRSVWSRINIDKVDALIAAGRMTPAGLAAYRRLSPALQTKYSYENKPRQLSADYTRRFQAAAGAWTFFKAQPPGYRRTASFWVMSAVRPETRLRRMATLIRDSGAGRRLDMLTNTRSKGAAKK